MAVKTWFITGTSRGFGREWAIAALERGDQVAATARDIASLDDLVAKYGDAILPIRAGRHRPRRRLRRREAGARALRAAGHRGQQRRLRALRHGRGDHRGGDPGAAGDATCSARSGSPRRRCRTCARRAAGTSCRCRRSAASPRSRTPAPTTPPSGRWRASARASRRRWPGSASGHADRAAGYSTDWAGSSAQALGRAARLRHRSASRRRMPARPASQARATRPRPARRC